MQDDAWMVKAACRGLDPEVSDRIFFPELHKGEQQDVRRAKAFCIRCPVRRHCLAFAVAHKERHGVWGGMSEGQRKAISRPVKEQIRRRWFSVYKRRGGD
jgi:WhiB family transcriptional regulator, redox-sensing transcriptional regulator